MLSHVVHFHADLAWNCHLHCFLHGDVAHLQRWHHINAPLLKQAPEVLQFDQTSSNSTLGEAELSHNDERQILRFL